MENGEGADDGLWAWVESQPGTLLQVESDGVVRNREEGSGQEVTPPGLALDKSQRLKRFLAQKR